MRAALLQNLGDPYLLQAWLHLYKTVWKDEVDKLYVYSSSLVDRSVLDYCSTIATEAGAVALSDAGGIPTHGNAINRLLDACQEDLIVLVEDDGWILESGHVKDCFTRIENGTVDVVGSSRNSCTPELVAATAKKFHITDVGPEHRIADAPNLWPNLMFARRETLLRTDRNFGPYGWKKGDTIPLLDHKCANENSGDTFVWATIQMRAMGCKFHYINQHHAAPCDAHDFRHGRGLFGFHPLPWVHFGSLSSMYTQYLRDDRSIPLGLREHPDAQGPMKDSPFPSVAQRDDEVARRVAICKMLVEHYPIQDPALQYFNDVYAGAVQRAIGKCNFSDKQVQKYVDCYKHLLGKMFS